MLNLHIRYQDLWKHYIIKINNIPGLPFTSMMSLCLSAIYHVYIISVYIDAIFHWNKNFQFISVFMSPLRTKGDILF